MLVVPEGETGYYPQVGPIVLSSDGAWSAGAYVGADALLILDEVMAGLSAVEVDEVLEIVLGLNQRGMTIIMVEHIMRAIMRFSQRVVCLDAGKIVAEGTPAHIVDDPNVQRIYLGA